MDLRLLFLLFLLAQVADTAQTGRSEVEALLKFKDNNYNDSQTGFWSSWDESDETPCSWIGVTCTTSATVEQLNLPGWGITLVDLKELSSLTDLRQLDLSSQLGPSSPYYVQIWGVEDIGNMFPGLTRLDLSGNELTADILSSIASCRNLTYISLEHNSLTGGIPSLDELGQLQFLRLARNSLSGPIPEGLRSLTQLVSIDLSHNSFNGTIPSLASMSHLTEIKLDGNKLTGFAVPENPVARSVGMLSVSENLLSGSIPSGLRSLPNLRVLNLSRNLLNGTIPSQTSMKNGLLSLDLSQNQLTGKIPPDLLRTNDKSSPFLNLSHNRLSGSIPLNNTVSYSFNVLDLSYNNLDGPIPRSHLSNINSLWLQNNHLSGDIADALSYSPSELRLQNNNFSGDLASANVSVGDLQSVDLSDNDFRMSASEAVTDPFSNTLQNFMGYGQLTEFRVAGNNFSGASLPKEFYLRRDGSGQQISVLDFSRCHLKGGISSATFNSTSLPALQVLNLSNNDLTGPLPASIVAIDSLTVLDVSNNRLSRSLPLIKPASSLYNPSFFTGNDGLCGDPLPPCHSNSVVVPWWLLLIIIGGSSAIALGSCLLATWRWTVYRKRHEQDADLIKTLMERDAATLMTLRELKKATNNFDQTAQIGEGGFGTVYVGKLDDGTTVAIKRSKREGSENDKEQFLNEVRILSHVQHRCLVKLLGCCMENKIAVLVFEYVPNGTLKEHLNGDAGKAPLSWKQRLNIAVQTADALYYLHSAATFPIYHRDVKSANILLSDDLNAKVADFGISKLAPLQATHVSTAAVQGTLGYIDPDYYTSFQLTDKSDVYSFGVVLLELISAKPAIDFSRGGQDTSLVNFASPQIQRGDIQALIDPTLMESYNDPGGLGRESILNVGRLAMKCLDMRSKARPSMKEVLQDLQNLWLEVTGTSRQLDSITEHENEFPNVWMEGSNAFQPMDSITDDEDTRSSDHAGLLSASYSAKSSDLTVRTDPGGIRM